MGPFSLFTAASPWLARIAPCTLPLATGPRSPSANFHVQIPDATGDTILAPSSLITGGWDKGEFQALLNFAEIGNSHALAEQAFAQLVRAIMTEVGDQPAPAGIAGNGGAANDSGKAHHS